MISQDSCFGGHLKINAQQRTNASGGVNTLFIVKFASLGKHQQPISMVIAIFRNAYQLKWLRSRVVYSRHTNLQERLLGDLKCKLLCGVVNADLGICPCNCPTKFKVNGECAY